LNNTTITTLKEGSPVIVLLSWLIGLPWPQIAAMLAAFWTLWLMYDKAVTKYRAWRAKRNAGP
jgi:hypothetical protein